MRVFKQRQSSTCAPRSIQTALVYFGIECKYSKIKSLCGTDYIGTSIPNISKAVEYFGLRTNEYIGSEVDIEKIVEGINSGALVMVHWHIGNGISHVANAYGYDDKFIYLTDTSAHLYTEPFIAMRKTMLERCWLSHPDSRWLLVMYL